MTPKNAHVLVWSALVVGALTAFILVGLHGWTYYTTPVGARVYTPSHHLLRPSGQAGQLFGVGGFLLMLVPIAYAIRKKARWLRDAGSIKTWLDIHVFSGILGPVLVTFHTSFKFNGIVAVAYWSMVAVVLSGFVGRYLHVRIPRSLRGHELSQTEVDARALELSRAIAAAGLPDRMLTEIDAFERKVVPADHPSSMVSLVTGEIAMRRELARLRRHLAERGNAQDLHEDALLLIAERATLVRRIAYLKKTKKLFDVWHVFHMPLVYVMFAIVVMHVAVTVYLGYVPFRN